MNVTLREERAMEREKIRRKIKFVGVLPRGINKKKISPHASFSHLILFFFS